jgi:hypothetical protein
VGDYSHIDFGQKFLGGKESVRLCVVVVQQPVLLLPKFGTKSSHIFTDLELNVTAVCETDCMVCQDELFVSNPFDVNGNDDHALGFAFHLFRPFSVSVNLTFCVRLMLSSPNACLIIARVSVALFPRFAQNLMLFHCDSSQTALDQVHDSKRKDVKISTYTQLSELLYTDCQDMLVLSSTIA